MLTIPTISKMSLMIKNMKLEDICVWANHLFYLKTYI